VFFEISRTGKIRLGTPYSKVKEVLSKSSLHCLTASTMILNGLRLTDDTADYRL